MVLWASPRPCPHPGQARGKQGASKGRGCGGAHTIGQTNVDEACTAGNRSVAGGIAMAVVRGG